MPGHPAYDRWNPRAYQRLTGPDSPRKGYVRQAPFVLDIYISFWHTLCMIDSNLVQQDAQRGLSLSAQGSLSGSGQTFIVDMAGCDKLYLFVDLVWAAASALVFTFENAGILDPANYYSELLETGAVKSVSVSVSASTKFKLPVDITGLGTSTGKIRVKIVGTGATGDTVTVTPVAARTMTHA